MARQGSRGRPIRFRVSESGFFKPAANTFEGLDDVRRGLEVPIWRMTPPNGQVAPSLGCSLPTASVVKPCSPFGAAACGSLRSPIRFPSWRLLKYVMAELAPPVGLLCSYNLTPLRMHL